MIEGRNVLKYHKWYSTPIVRENRREVRLIDMVKGIFNFPPAFIIEEMDWGFYVVFVFSGMIRPFESYRFKGTPPIQRARALRRAADCVIKEINKMTNRAHNDPVNVLDELKRFYTPYYQKLVAKAEANDITCLEVLKVQGDPRLWKEENSQVNIEKKVI